MQESALEQSIRSWLNALQSKVPGSQIVLIVTHVDQVEAAKLEAQCSQVKQMTESWIKTAKASHNKLPSIWADGESFRVNCLSGEGIDPLRTSIVKLAKSLPWYQELLPASWIRIQETMFELGNAASGTMVPFLNWKGLC